MTKQCRERLWLICRRQFCEINPDKDMIKLLLLKSPVIHCKVSVRRSNICARTVTWCGRTLYYYLSICVFFRIFVQVFVCYKVSMWKSNIYIYMRAHSNNIQMGVVANCVCVFVYLCICACICVLIGEHVKKQQCAHTLFKIHQLELLSIYFCISL